MRSLLPSKTPFPSLPQVGCSYITDVSSNNTSSPDRFAEIDSIFTRELRHSSEDILSKTGQPYQLNVFSGVEHGFAIRADLSKPQNKFAKEQAFLQALAWFNYGM